MWLLLLAFCTARCSARAATTVWPAILLRLYFRNRGLALRRLHAECARRAGVGGCCRCSEDPRAPADARWHRKVVGDLIGSGPSQEQAIVGETLRQQPVEALGAWTARGLFLRRSMARPRVLRGVILGLPFCSAMIGYSVGSTFSS
jgi:hypothetical protein